MSSVRIIAKKALRDFWERPARAEQPLRAWHAAVRTAAWQTPADVKSQFGNASVISSGRVVFNVGGNRYRIVTAIRYDLGIVFVRFVGTHSEYDGIDAREI